MKTVPIGIDLGTTNCCIAWLDGDEIKVYRDEAGLFTIPSIVAQTKDGTILAGWRARRVTDPVVRHGFAKRYLGTGHTFSLLEGEVPAWVISQHLLQHLKQCAEQAVGGPVAAVVAYPAHFSQVQIEESRRAAQGAGLELIDMLTEPVAAGIAFKHHKQLSESSGEQLIEVFDMGGGTTDITLCLSSENRIEVTAGGRAFCGDNFLGGVDFDKALVSIAVEKLEKQNLPQVSMGDDLPKKPWLWNLMLSAERCKVRLSEDMETQWKQELYDSNGMELATFDEWVGRAAFERKIEKLVNRTLDLCDKALLRHAGYEEPDGSDRQREALRKTASSLSQIILVGGSTRVPLVRERVKAHHRELGAENLMVTGYREDEAVAMGAAVYAALRATDRPASQSSSWLSWTVPPMSQVSSDISVHPALRGTARSGACNGWSVRYHTGSATGTAAVNSDGRFVIPAFSLSAGDNPVDLVLLDTQGTERETHSTGIRHAGFSVGDPGLANSICIRLIEGMHELVKAGTLTDALTESRLYTNDKTPVVRAPLYEGHSLLTTIEFPADAEPGTPVVIRARCKAQQLELEFKVGDGPSVRRPVELLAPTDKVNPENSRARYEVLVSDIAEHLKNLPNGSSLQRAMEKEWQALRLDLEIEFENQGIRDDARIDDRLRQMALFDLRLQAFSVTSEGLSEKAKTVRQQVRAAGADAELLRELDDIEAQVSHCEDAGVLSVLNARLNKVSRNIYSRDRSEVSPELLALIVTDFRDRISRIRLAVDKDREGTEKREVIEKVRWIEGMIDRLLASPAEPAAKFNRLILLQHETIDPLYQAEVIRRGQAGLLRVTAR